MASGNLPGDNDSYLIYVPVGVFFAVCPALVGMRLWSRLRKGGRLGSDDITIIISLAFALASSAIEIASCYYGYGQRVANLTAYNKKQALFYFYLCQITYKASINLTKASILLLYLRIFGGIKWFKYATVFLISVVGMYWIASVVATIFQCTPIVRAFDKTVAGTCIDNGKFWYANAGFSIATDLLILIIPIPLVYALQISRAQKIGLLAVFCLGIFVIITSCLRITTINIQATTNDQTYDISSTMWTVIEMNLAICCACLPQIRPLIAKVFPSLMPGSSGYGQDRSGRPTRNSTNPIKSYKSTQSQDEADHRWARVDGKDGINMTSVRKGDSSSEEYILQDDHNNTIQKTTQFSIEYSKARTPEAV